MTDTDFKKCYKCLEIKNLSDFSKCKNKKDGLNIWCKLCDRKNKKKWHDNNIDKVKKYKKENPLKVRFWQGKSQSKRKGRIWNLNFEQFCEIASKPCYYCENKLGNITQMGYGLDRLNNSNEYNFNNCVSCCDFCNTKKSHNLSANEWKEMSKLLITMRDI